MAQRLGTWFTLVHEPSTSPPRASRAKVQAWRPPLHVRPTLSKKSSKITPVENVIVDPSKRFGLSVMKMQKDWRTLPQRTVKAQLKGLPLGPVRARGVRLASIQGDTSGSHNCFHQPDMGHGGHLPRSSLRQSGRTPELAVGIRRSSGFFIFFSAGGTPLLECCSLVPFAE